MATIFEDLLEDHLGTAAQKRKFILTAVRMWDINPTSFNVDRFVLLRGWLRKTFVLILFLLDPLY
jgi:hypothetical protein